MKQLLISLLAAGSLLCGGAAHAGVLSFDELDAGGKLASIGKYNPYAGFTFSSSVFLGVNTVAGYDNAARSGANFLLNGFGVNKLTISGAGAFDFAGAWFATPNTNGSKASWVNITAYDSLGTALGSTGNVAIDGAYRFIDAHFEDVAQLVITRDRGWFVMDDFTLAEPAEVPEPAGLFGLALGAALLMSRRRA